ncbi:3-oxoacyl-ACP synthase III family protein [Solihabitans fulvus]|uniref:3-oxoacyl-ACP synthase III family protein n=1 Tax=Solihabitans fulvus TaxID=1892852 RepID=UPI001661CADD|nr:3-oxoacyl-[acyl-carrier-protein] synthase III C-terminal domain-containing protein [Solihabitans fulvus]
MIARVRLRGVGHVVGSETVSNTDVASALGLPPTWLTDRTGIRCRRVCGDGEDVLGLAVDAVTRACADASLSMSDLGDETMLLHIQSGHVAFTPPGGVLLAGRLGLDRVRVLGLDGVCAEPIAGLEYAVLMLQAGRCARVVLSTSADFVSYVDPKDAATVGLFGAGASAVVLERAQADEPAGTVRGLRWETHAEHWKLGRLPILRATPHDAHVSLDVGYYQMDGQRLARVAIRAMPAMVGKVLEEAGWAIGDIDLVIAHQPNAKMLEMGVRALGLNANIVPMPVRELGNMGPASLFVNLSLARAAGRTPAGTRLLLIAFGLGFSCGAAAIEL